MSKEIRVNAFAMQSSVHHSPGLRRHPEEEANAKLSQFELEAPLPVETKDNAVHSMIESFTSADPSRVWTLQEVVEHNGIGGRGPLLVGTPADIADAMQLWVEETDVDGFNLSYAVMPETYVDFVDLVVPELQRRGVYKTDYAPGTLRAKLHGQAALKASYPGAAFRSLEEVDPAARTLLAD